MKMTIVCESIKEIKLENYEAEITFGEVKSIEYDYRDIDDLIEMIGAENLLDAIGKRRVVDHFNIIEKED